MKEGLKMYYLAYGSNLNISDMKIRCPKARAVGNTVLNDYRLVFCGEDQASWLTVKPFKGDYVPLGIWEIEASDEASMDIYEGYPELYDKKMISVSFHNETVAALIYIMNDTFEEAKPARSYVDACRQGYMDFSMDLNILQKALRHCGYRE